MNIIKSHKELEVYQLSFKTSMGIFHITRSFPKDEIYSLTSQIRRSSRSVSANFYQKAYSEYENIIEKIVRMISHPEKWSI